MMLIIDGYNVLKQAHGNHGDSNTKKKKFISQLVSYATKRKLEIIVVFDGGDSSLPYKEQYAHTVVVHSGFKLSADDYIKQLIDKQDQSETLLVSTDRELNRYADKNNIPSIDALDFYHLLHDARPITKHTNNQQPLIKISKRTIADIDALMAEESEMVFNKDEQEIQQNNYRKSKSDHLSKQERKLLKKVKKL